MRDLSVGQALAPGVRAAVRAAAVAAVLLLVLIGAASIGHPAEVAATVAEPPLATDGRLRIPSLGVDAPLGVHRVAADGTLPAPYGPIDVAWYDFSQHPGLGGIPGTSGNTILSGHLNYAANVPYAGVRYTGPGVFADLGQLSPGARIEIVRGQTVAYRVVSVEVLPAVGADWLTEFGATPGETLTLFTCTGDFNPRTFNYSDRTVVKAVRVTGAARQLDATPDGRFVYGVGGTSDPLELLSAQLRSITALYAQDIQTGEWLTYMPGAPVFINTLLGRLRPDAFVVGKVAP